VSGHDRFRALIERFNAAWRPVVIEAADGSGKDELAHAIARSVECKVMRLGDSGWIEAVNSDDPVVLVERERRASEPEIDRLLAEALDVRTSAQPCLITARRFGARVGRLVSRQRLERLTERDLWFDFDSLSLLVQLHGGTEDTTRLILELTEGWPRMIWDLQEFPFAWTEANSLDITTVLRNSLTSRMREATSTLAPEVNEVLTIFAWRFGLRLLQMSDMAPLLRRPRCGRRLRLGRS